MGRGEANPVWDSWVKNEFLNAMRAKGKLPGLRGPARDRKLEDVGPQTKERIFHSEEKMLDLATQKLEGMKKDMEAKHRKRHDLKSRIRQLESALITEKRATMALESEINGMRGSD